MQNEETATIKTTVTEVEYSDGDAGRFIGSPSLQWHGLIVITHDGKVTGAVSASLIRSFQVLENKEIEIAK